MIRLNVFIRVAAENRAAALQAAKELVAASLSDKGCIAYDVFESATRPDVLMICETWADEASLDTHQKSAHFITLVPRIESLIGRLKDIWRVPYPAYITSWKTVTVPAAIIFLILYLLEPFGLSRLESGLLWVSLGAALISAGVSSVFAWALPRVFPRWYAERGWTLGKEVVNTLALLLAIAVCVWLYVAWLTGMMLSFRLFFIVLLWVLSLPYGTAISSWQGTCVKPGR